LFESRIYANFTDFTDCAGLSALKGKLKTGEVWRNWHQGFRPFQRVVFSMLFTDSYIVSS
jgi:hypothetical protein